MPLSNPSLHQEWEHALAHAGFAAEDFCVFEVEGERPENGRLAIWWRPWVDIEDNELLRGEQKDAAEADPCNRRHRVAIWSVDPDDPLAAAIVGAKLRHELHHARQWLESGSAVFDLDPLVDEILSRKAGGLNGSGVFYNLKPIEQDANAAAAMFLREYHADLLDAALADSEAAPLARSLTGPAPSPSLVARTVAFMFLFVDICDASEAEIGPWGDYLELHVPGAGEIWSNLKAGAEATPGQPVALLDLDAETEGDD